MSHPRGQRRAARSQDGIGDRSVGRLAGRVCLVTGGGSGIGRATAVRMADEQAEVVVVAGRRSAEGLSVVDECRARGVQAVFTATDVTDEDQVRALVESTVATYGRLDVVFNNAGLQEARAELAEQEPATFDAVFAVNVRGLFLCLRHQLPVMRARGSGAIVVNTSVSGVRNPNTGLAIYSASKAAAISMTRSAALEYAPHGIRVNAVAPGRVLTDMMRNAQLADLSSIAGSLPVRRMGTPEDVAGAVVWLASDDAAYVSGHVLAADGGFLAS